MREISLYQFDVLTDEEKLALVEQDGVFLESLQENKWCSFLYRLHNFYVEIYIHPKRIQAKRIRTSTNTDLLEPYLRKIDISVLGL